jgi:hypothetical protein
VRAEQADFVFPVGETIQYEIHVSGLRVGTQTVRVHTRELYNGVPVYRITSQMKTSGFMDLFHRYSEQWTVLIDEKQFYPVWVERQIEDRGATETYTYAIDQTGRKVAISKGSGEITVVQTDHVVFDRLSLCYYYRVNPSFFSGGCSFDFLFKESVNTVSMEKVGLADIQIPRMYSGNPTTTTRFMEKGGNGIEVFIGIEGFTIPLKIVFRTPLPNRKRVAEVELFIEGYAARSEALPVPKRYHRLLNRSLLTLHG